MITAEEAKRLSSIAIEKQKAENFNFVIKDIDKEIQKAVNKGYTSIYYDITRLVDTMKVREYLLSYGYLCDIINDMGGLGFRISWNNPEIARELYKQILLTKKIDGLLFKFDDLEVK